MLKMEVSNEIKEDIRKTQSDLKHAIRIHQVWVTRLKQDENNIHLKSKVKEAENDIIAIGQAQKLVVDKLRRELEMYQQRLKARNKQVNVEGETRHVARQLREHQTQHRRDRHSSLLKAYNNDLHIKTEHSEELKENVSDSDEKSSNNSGEYPHYTHAHGDRDDFSNALHKVKEVLIGSKPGSPACESGSEREWWDSPSPPPADAAHITQDAFMRYLGLVTPAQKEALEKKRSERRKRPNDKQHFLYGGYEMMPKRKKMQFPYLQTPNEPPQTRSAKLRKQQNQNKSSREGSPSGSSGENKAWDGGERASWAALRPACQVCGRNDVVSLLCACECGRWQHTRCGATPGRCAACRRPLPDPPRHTTHHHHYRDKLAERKSLQEKNVKLCVELSKLECRAASLKARLEAQQAHKRQLAAQHGGARRQLQRLLDFIARFRDTASTLRDAHPHPPTPTTTATTAHTD